MLHAGGVGIQRKYLEAFSKQMHQISPVAASCVKDAHAGWNVPPQNLIEDIDINLPELLLNGHLHRVTILTLAFASAHLIELKACHPEAIEAQPGVPGDRSSSAGWSEGSRRTAGWDFNFRNELQIYRSSSLGCGVSWHFRA